MKYYFFDTSALFKRYQRERGSDVIDRIFALPDVKLIVLNVTITEVLSNFFRLRNIGEISNEELETLIAVFSGEISSRFEIYPIGPRPE
ncbi:MAG: type II toxin-antitoxin system VapC family toxin [Desulfomonile tiedjei]|nr:type II toxin-antitoxin system VapC family toxin [Desulfomonile tiedjei]